MNLEQIWREDELVDKLGLTIGKVTGRSRTLSNWVAEGLAYIEKNGRRYFLEDEVIEFLLKFKKCQKAQKTC